MRVYDEYRPVFSALDGYITAFEKHHNTAERTDGHPAVGYPARAE